MNTQKNINISGPVFPLLTMFKEDGSIDENSMVDYIEFLINQGAETIMTTVGTSRYDVMTIDEMKAVNSLLVQTVANRAITIITTPSIGPTYQSIEFVSHGEIIGADAILAVYPDRYYGHESIYEYFRDLDEKADSIGIMVHEMAIRAGRAQEAPSWQYSMDILEKISTLKNFCGMKEESGDDILIKEINSRFANQYSIIGGRGGMGSHIKAIQYGQKSYLTGIGNFNPKIELDFYRYILTDNLKEASYIVENIEKPFFEFSVNVGWHIVLKEAMHIMGLSSPYERDPMRRINSKKREELEKLMKSLSFI